MSHSLLAVLIVTSLLGGGIAHAMISHEHGHSHEGKESSVWTSLHSSLRHEDKKLVVMLVESVVLSVVAFITISISLAASVVQVTAIAETRDPYAREALRRGIYRYRVFG